MEIKKTSVKSKHSLYQTDTTFKKIARRAINSKHKRTQSWRELLKRVNSHKTHSHFPRSKCSLKQFWSMRSNIVRLKAVCSRACNVSSNKPDQSNTFFWKSSTWHLHENFKSWIRSLNPLQYLIRSGYINIRNKQKLRRQNMLSPKDDYYLLYTSFNLSSISQSASFLSIMFHFFCFKNINIKHIKVLKKDLFVDQRR